MVGAINGFGGLNATNYAALYNDPYFQQAFNSPNINAQQALNNQNLMSKYGVTTPQAATTASTVTPQNAPSFKGASEEISGGEKKKSGIGKWILGALAVAGIAFGGYKCFTKGSGQGLSKIWDGAKQYLNGASKSVKGLANKAKGADDVFTIDKADDVFTIAKNGDDILCTVPGKVNNLRGAGLADDIAKFGADDIANLADKNSKLRSYSFTAEDGSVFRVVKGKITSCMKDGKNVTEIFNNADNASFKKTVEGMIKEFEAGKNLDKLSDITFSSKKNGISRLFTAASASDKPVLKAAVTKQFDVNSTAVKAYRQQYPQLSEAIDEFGKDVTSKFKVFSADKVTDIGTFKIQGDKIAGIQTPTGYHALDSDGYRALLFDNKEIFDGVLSDPKKFTNIIYQAA